MENKKTYKKWNNNTKSQRRKEELKETVKGFLLFTDKNKEKNVLFSNYSIFTALRNLNRLYYYHD